MTYIDRLRTVAAIAATLGIAAAPAAHAQTFYENVAAFDAAAIAPTTYDFNAFATPGNYATDPDALITPGPGRITFSVTGGSGDARIIVADADVNGGVFRLGDNSDTVLAGNPVGTSSVTRIRLDNAYTAFAIEYGLDNDRATTYSFALYSGETPVGNAFTRGFIGGNNFFGATSAIAFDNVRVTAAPTDTNPSVVFDNARTGFAAVVPEAGTIALLLPALGVLGAVVVRRKVRAA